LNSNQAVVKHFKDGKYQSALTLLNQSSDFGIRSGVKITAIRRGYAEGEFVVPECVSNGAHACTSILLTLADTVAGAAVLPYGDLYSLNSSSFNFYIDSCTGTLNCKVQTIQEGSDVLMFQVTIFDGSGTTALMGISVFSNCGVQTQC